MADDPEISLRHYIERIIDERDDRYEAKFKAVEALSQAKFEALESHIARALIATTESKHTFLSFVAIALSVAAFFLSLFLAFRIK